MFQWTADPEPAFTQMTDSYIAWLRGALLALASRYAVEIEAHMKANAVWEDRTGNLRQSLYAEVSEFVGGIAIGFDYGLDYGFWLEFAHQARFAIIAPTLDEFGPRIVADVQRLLS